MQHRDRVPEAVGEPGDDLRGERDLGHEDDRAAALRERRRGRAQVHLGLARAGDAVEEQPRRLAGRAIAASTSASTTAWSAVSSGCARRAPTAVCSGARRTARRSSRTTPRRSRRRSAGRSEPATRGPVARRSSSSAAWRGVSPSAAPVASAHQAIRARVPGDGDARASARAGVEQYSAAIQKASSTRSAGRVASRISRGATSFSSATSDASATPTTTPSTSRCAERHDEHATRSPRRRGAGSRTGRAARGPS